jgi:polar amino acid transport system substrate-binding protein
LFGLIIKRFILWPLFIGSCLTISTNAQTVTDYFKINVVTEESYPLQYSFRGEITGPATILVKKVLIRAEIPFDIQVLPWARAYKTALHERNVLIYSIARTEQREPLFHWIGKVYQLHYALYGSKTLTLDPSLPLTALNQYRIGVVRNSAIHQYLVSHGVTNLALVSSGPQNLQKLLAGRVDIIPANVDSFKDSCLLLELDCQNITVLRPLPDAAKELYFALSKNTSQILVDKIKQAYQQIISEQETTAIPYQTPTNQ